MCFAKHFPCVVCFTNSFWPKLFIECYLYVDNVVHGCFFSSYCLIKSFSHFICNFQIVTYFLWQQIKHNWLFDIFSTHQSSTSLPAKRLTNYCIYRKTDFCRLNDYRFDCIILSNSCLTQLHITAQNLPTEGVDWKEYVKRIRVNFNYSIEHKMKTMRTFQRIAMRVNLIECSNFVWIM